MPIEIRSRITGEVVYIWPGDTLRRADLSGVNLSEADLSEADLSEADLSGANLYGANMYAADLRRADLRGANLYGASLCGADLSEASLYGANMYAADLRCSGNMRQLRTMQIDTWQIGYTHDTLQIGCQRHAIDKWARWNTEAGRAWIAKMDSAALAWAERNLDLVLAIIAANPAEK